MSGADSLVPPNCWIGEPSPAEVGALLVDVDVCAAERPAELARRHQVESRAVLGEARRARSTRCCRSASRAFANWNAVRRRLRVAAEVRARARGDHGRVGGGGADVVDSTPASPVLSTTVTPAATACALNWRVRSCAVSGIGLLAERLAEDVGVVVRDRVVERPGGRVESKALARVAEHLHADQRGAGRDALDADVAARGQRVRRVDERREVVDLPALGGDRAGVAERLGGAGRGVRAVTAEVLVVDEDVRAVGADEVGVVRCPAPSAKKATFTPSPVARLCACGVLGSLKAVCVVWSASGSSSGLLGSVGQVPGPGCRSAPWTGGARATVPGLAGFGSVITASGTTLATALLWRSLAASPAEMRAANAFSVVNWWLTRPPERATWATSGRWSARTARTRADTRRRVAGSARCWLRSTTIMRCDELRPTALITRERDRPR